MAKITLSELRNVIRKIILKESNLSELETQELKKNVENFNQDMELIEKAKQGNQLAFSKLMARYKEGIFYRILKMVHDREEAEDVVMITFSKAFQNIHTFNPDFAFSTWLYKIAKNSAIDFIRKKRLETTPIEMPSMTSGKDDEYKEVIPVKDDSDNPEQALQRKQTYKKLEMYINKLDIKYKKLIKMFFFDGLSYDEMASELKLPLGTVKAQLFRAKENLLKMVKDDKDIRNENKKIRY